MCYYGAINITFHKHSWCIGPQTQKNSTCVRIISVFGEPQSITTTHISSSELYNSLDISREAPCSEGERNVNVCFGKLDGQQGARANIR